MLAVQECSMLRVPLLLPDLSDLQLVNFSIVPVHLRIPFVAGVSFAWWVTFHCNIGKGP
jgi:hypothetical protein